MKQFILPLSNELIVDVFAGGGGASTGIELAIGRHVDIAVNHDPRAISLHQANHPQTKWMVERYGYEKARRIGVVAMVGGKDKTRIRNATPVAFRDALLDIARRAA